MDFNEQYLTYDEYESIGGSLSNTPFNLLEYEARKKIDERTFGRLIGKGQNYQEVKVCIYKLINILNSYNDVANQNKAISSESIDGYSISYSTPTTATTEAKNSEIEDNIDSCLSNLIVDGQKVLFRGANEN